MQAKTSSQSLLEDHESFEIDIEETLETENLNSISEKSDLENNINQIENYHVVHESSDVDSVETSVEVVGLNTTASNIQIDPISNVSTNPKSVNIRNNEESQGIDSADQNSNVSETENLSGIFVKPIETENFDQMPEKSDQTFHDNQTENYFQEQVESEVTSVQVVGSNTPKSNPQINLLPKIVTVSCMELLAKMDTSKFSSGSKGKCIQFGEDWLTPNEFQEISGSK